MNPQFASALADRLHGYRRFFLAFALIAFVALAAALFLSRDALTASLASAAMGPLAFFPWGLLCLCSWFGPDGRHRAPYSGSLQRAFSWYAAIFLTVFLFIAAAWPFLVLFH